MKRIEKIKLNRDFRRIYGKGKPIVSKNTVVYCLKRRDDKVRLGITAGKKIGGAVERNRAKRVITAAFYECLPYIRRGCDTVVVARSRILKSKSTKVAEEMKRQFSEAGFWYEP